MEASRWQQIETLFHDCLEQPATSRLDYLRRITAGDQALYDQVQVLLQAESAELNLTKAIASEASDLADQLSAGDLAVGSVVDGYEIIGVLGEGGMGRVYDALQHTPIKRPVALKVVHQSLASPRLKARFENERQALALMEHPGIARVFDAGATADGVPYFVMERVQGQPLHHYLKEQLPQWRSLIKILINICRGVEHAHQKGIIHRDLKPSNILITTVDDGASPKVIDFGIAKATAGEATLGDGVATGIGQVVGTPRYMSPEQADSYGVAADTRSDVYALGTIIYEILADQHPLDTEKLDSMNASERQQAYTGAKVPGPSTLGYTALEVPKASARELDHIVLKALSVSADERYASAGDLADDLQRLLNNEPVLAQPPSRRYLAKKFYQRNRVATLAGVGIAVTILTGTALSLVSLVRALEAETIANAEADKARSVSEFMIGLFEAADPTVTAESRTAKELLDLGAERIQTQLQDQPVTRANLRSTIGRVYEMLGLRTQSVEHLEAALAAFDDQGERSATTIQTLISLATSYDHEGAFERSEQTISRALALSEELGLDQSIHYAEALAVVGHLRTQQGAFEEAKAVQGQSLALMTKLLPGTRELALSQSNLARVHYMIGEMPQAEQLIQQAIETFLASGSASPELSQLYNGLGAIRGYSGRHEEALEAHQQALEILKARYGDNPLLVQSYLNVAHSQLSAGRLDESRAHFDQAFALLASYGEDVPPGIQIPLHSMAAVVYAQLGEIDRGRELAHIAVQLSERHLDPNSPRAVDALQQLAFVEREDGNAELSKTLYEQVLAHRSERLGPLDSDVIGPMLALAEIAAYQSKTDAALSGYREVVDRVLQGDLVALYPQALSEYESLLETVGDSAALAEWRDRKSSQQATNKP